MLTALQKSWSCQITVLLNMGTRLSHQTRKMSVERESVREHFSSEEEKIRVEDLSSSIVNTAIHRQNGITKQTFM